MRNHSTLSLLTLPLVLLLAACSAGGSTPPAPTPAPTPAPAAATAPPVSQPALSVTSTAFAEGGSIPRKYSCQGNQTSPEIKWSGAPAGTQSYALIMDDPDAPVGTFTHWVAFDIPASQTEIAEGAMKAGKGGKNSAGQTSYVGPCPPSGTHRYFFTVYALKTASLNLAEGASREQVVKAMAGEIIAQGQLMGRYQKQ